MSNDRNVQGKEQQVSDPVASESSYAALDQIGALNDFHEFLEHDERLVKLKCLADSQQPHIDIFDVLQIHRNESIHSNFLAWLLNPQQNHGVGSHFLQNFLVRTADTAKEKGIPAVSPDKIRASDWTETDVIREWNYIDIFVLNRKSGIVCAVENKVWSGESFDENGESQLARYRETLDKAFPDFDKHLVFLSPLGRESNSEAEREFWVSENYLTIRELVSETLRKKSNSMDSEVVWFLSQYETTLRSNVVSDDNRIRELARHIYLEHRDVIELINLHKPNYSAEIKEIIKEAFSQQDGWVLDAESPTLVRIRPESWDRFATLKTGTGWAGTSALLLFEYSCPADPLETWGTALTLAPGTNEAVRQRLYETVQQNPGVFNPRHTSLREGFTILNDYSHHPLSASDLGTNWIDGAIRDKLMDWVKQFVEYEYPAINESIMQPLEEFEADKSELGE